MNNRTENGSLFSNASFDVSFSLFKTGVNVHIFFIFRRINFIYRILSDQAKYIVEI